MTKIIAKPNKVLHTMLRVSNLEDSIKFYSEYFGMKLIKKLEFEEAKFTLAFLGYGTTECTTELELTYNWGENTYTHGSAYGHMAFATTDITGFCEYLAQQGVKITRAPGPMGSGPVTSSIAFLDDPDGYKVELIQKA
jgi:lactoylglutathione lyase